MTLNEDLATRPSRPATAVLTVSQLHEDLRSALEEAGLARLWVSGVVTGLRRGPRFTSWELVEYGQDAAEVRAMLSVGAFPRDLARITTVLAGAGLELADGLEVALCGRMDSNPGFGRLRLLAHGVDPRASVGAAVLARDAVVAELEAAGDLAAQQGLHLPAVLRRVGLVSSPTAAGRADVLAVLERCPLPIELVEASAAMGGPEAPVEVATALGTLARADVDVDVILVARGGGARSDLAPWDSAELARSIARCPVPVWMALGHARDRTVADLVAHRSYPTPSAAAAALVATSALVVHQRAQASSQLEHRAELAAAQRRLRWAVAVALGTVVVLALLVWAGLR